MTIRRIALCCIFAFAVCSPPSEAAIIAVAGDGEILDPLVDFTSAEANAFDDTGAPGDEILIHGWDELQSFALPGDVLVDIAAPGLYDDFADLGDFTITAGTVVNSHLLYLDPLLDTTRLATFTFDTPIVGVIVRNGTSAADDRLLATDFLGNPSTTYPAAFYSLRGLEYGPETVFISADGLSLTTELTASDPGDQIRVLTAVDVQPPDPTIPEPATSLLIGTGLVAAGLVRRKLARR
jgi:hypothetical protein